MTVRDKHLPASSRNDFRYYNPQAAVEGALPGDAARPLTFENSLMFKSAYERVGGIVWIPRMLEKIRMNAKNELPEEFVPYLGKGFDGRCVSFLGVEYDELVSRTLEGGNDEEIFAWILSRGRRPSADEILIWNDFMSKRGWRDSDHDEEGFEAYKKKYDLGHRSDILTFFDFYEVDEGRKP